MTCTFERNHLRDDIATIKAIRENFRAHLLQAISEARASSIGMEPSTRDKLLDGISQNFHPDAGPIADAFGDAFFDAEAMAERRLEDAYNTLAAE